MEQACMKSLFAQKLLPSFRGWTFMLAHNHISILLGFVLIYYLNQIKLYMKVCKHIHTMWTALVSIVQYAT